MKIRLFSCKKNEVIVWIVLSCPLYLFQFTADIILVMSCKLFCIFFALISFHTL